MVDGVAIATGAGLLTEWMPHGRCVGWDPVLLSMQLSGDFMTWIAYCLIPFALVRFIRHNAVGVELLSGQRARNLYLWFAAFIGLCGLTHLMSIVTVWYGVYTLDAVFRIATGIVSLITVDRLWRANLEQDAIWHSPEHLDRVRLAIIAAQRAAQKLERVAQRVVDDAT